MSYFPFFHHARWHARRFAREDGSGRCGPGRGGFGRDGMGRDGFGHDGMGRAGFERGEGGWGRRGGPGRFGGRGDLGRFFAHGDLRLVILQLIAESPRSGYDLIKAIESLVGGAYSPSPGTVYPTLTLLEELGYVTVTPGEGSRKPYAITDEGRAFLDSNRRAVDALFARMAEAADVAGPPPAILRAMENLRLAVRLRLGRGPLGPDAVAAVAAALDAAATAVERS